MHKLAFGALWLVVLAVPLERAGSVEGVGTLPRILGLVALLCAVLAILFARQIRKPTWPLTLAAAFVLWGALSLTWTISADTGATKVQTYAQLLVLTWLIWEFAGTPQRQRSLMLAYVAGAGVLVAATMANVLTGALGSGRGKAFGSDANDLGLTIALGIPMAWHLARNAEARTVRWLAAAYMPATVVAVLLTASRGAMLATTIAVLPILGTLTVSSMRTRIAVVVLGGIALLGAMQVVPKTAWLRLSEGREEVTSGKLSYRGTIWRAGAQEFLSHPITGVGAGGFSARMSNVLSREYAAHNTFLGVAVDLGVVGIGLLLLLGLSVVRRSFSLPPPQRLLALGLLMTWTVGAMSLSWEHQKPTWFVLGLVIAQAGAWARRPGKKPPTAARRARPAAPWPPAITWPTPSSEIGGPSAGPRRVM